MTFFKLLAPKRQRRQDTQQSNTQFNDTRHTDNQHNDTQHKDTQWHNETQRTNIKNDTA